MRTFHLEIVTPDGLSYDGEAQSLLVHTTDGDVEILRCDRQSAYSGCRG